MPVGQSVALFRDCSWRDAAGSAVSEDVLRARHVLKPRLPPERITALTVLG